MFGYGTGLAVEDEDYIYLDGVTAGKNVGAGGFQLWHGVLLW